MEVAAAAWHAGCGCGCWFVVPGFMLLVAPCYASSSEVSLQAAQAWQRAEASEPRATLAGPTWPEDAQDDQLQGLAGMGHAT